MDYIKLAKTTINLLDSMVVCGESHTTTSKEMMSNAQKGLNKLQEDIDVKNSVYCPVCQSCGEEGCCSPTLCTNNKDGMYCESNMEAMKIAYQTLKDLYNWLYEDKEKNRDVLQKLEEIEARNEKNTFVKR